MYYFPVLSAIDLAPSFSTERRLGMSLLHFLKDVQSAIVVANSLSPTTDPSSDEYATGTNFNIPAGLNYTKILCTVRNPYARMAYYWLVTTKRLTPVTQTFSQWASAYAERHFFRPLLSSGVYEEVIEDNNKKNMRFGPIVYQLSAANLTVSSIIPIRYEHIPDDVRSLPFVDLSNAAQLSAYNAWMVPLPSQPTNWTGSYTSWTQLYDQTTADIVYNAFAADFAAFGYDKDSWKS
jgi:hypothetical protein